MAHRQIEVEEFLRLAVDYPVLDVRSPSEYGHAHIPNAISFPLFSDEERAIIGTLYKQTSREAAIRKGLDFFGPRLNRYLDDAEEIISRHAGGGIKDQTSMTFLVHCWRGGMRSAGVAWLLDLFGYRVIMLRGGYKAYRNWVLSQFIKDWNIRCLGGYTGSGKTEVLQSLNRHGFHVVDLEGIAKHKGSAFGGIGQSEKQPSQEMFENRLAMELNSRSWNQRIVQSDAMIWLEDESQRIGTVNIPQSFWEQMRSKGVLFIEISFDRRLEYIVEHYGKLDRSLLLAAISRLQKKLGGLETKNAIEYLLDDDMIGSFRILLTYYDKLYLKALEKKRTDLTFFECLPFDRVSTTEIAKIIIERYGHT